MQADRLSSCQNSFQRDCSNTERLLLFLASTYAKPSFKGSSRAPRDCCTHTASVTAKTSFNGSVSAPRDFCKILAPTPSFKESITTPGDSCKHLAAAPAQNSFQRILFNAARLLLLPRLRSCRGQRGFLDPLRFDLARRAEDRLCLRRRPLDRAGGDHRPAGRSRAAHHACRL